MINFADHVSQFVAATLTILATAVIALVRKVFTNEHKVAILEKQLEERDKTRRERDERIDNQLSEMRSDIKTLLRK